MTEWVEAQESGEHVEQARVLVAEARAAVVEKEAMLAHAQDTLRRAVANELAHLAALEMVRGVAVRAEAHLADVEAADARIVAAAVEAGIAGTEPCS